MTEFADLHFSAAFLERHALPDIGYPVPLARFLELIGSSDALDLAELLYWLQQQSSEAARDFRQYEPAMARLAQLLAPEDDERHRLGAGRRVVAGTRPGRPRRRNRHAAARRRTRRRDRAARGRPPARRGVPPARRVERQLADQPLSPRRRGRQGEPARQPLGVREGRFRAAWARCTRRRRARSYLSYWQYGLGILHDRTASPVFHPQRTLTPRRPAEVATELGIHYQLTLPSDD